MAQRALKVLTVLCLAVAAVGPARADTSSAVAAARTNATACAGKSYSYAGLESSGSAHGVSATIVERATPAVVDGHVAGWIGVGGMNAGPGGVPEWLQVGLVAFDDHAPSRLYYEIARNPKASYHEIAASVQPGERHRLAVLEISGRSSWWRVWVDGRPVSPPIHLPGSHGSWTPQAVAENQTGTGMCNGYSYEFSRLAVARASGGAWQPFTTGYVFQDPGYRVVRPTSTRFLASTV